MHGMEQENIDKKAEDVFELHDLDAPNLSGLALKLFANVIEHPVWGYFLRQRIMHTSGFVAFRERAGRDDANVEPEHYPIFFPQPPLPDRDPTLADVDTLFFNLNPILDDVTSRPAIRHYYDAYKSKRTTPLEVAERLLDYIRASNASPYSLNAIIRVDSQLSLTAARQSTERWQKNAPLSVLDGVPFSVKDMIDVAGYPTSGSSGFLEDDDRPRARDADVVAALHKAGMVMIAKCSQDELGIGVRGFSMYTGQTLNPHNKSRVPGGSSCGSGVAVATGLCAVSLGTDAGGSVRIPSLCNGVYSIKATFGRISVKGRVLTQRRDDEEISPCLHVGPIAGCMQDLALIYYVLSAFAPQRQLYGYRQFVCTPQLPAKELAVSVHGLRVGVCKPWLETASEQGIAATRIFIDKLVECGAEIVPVAIPALEDIRVSMPVALMQAALRQLNDVGAFRGNVGIGLGYEARGKLAIGREFNDTDALRACVVRAKAMAHAREIFKKVDFVVTPGVGCDVPLVPSNEKTGVMDVGAESRLMRFTIYGNVTGLPCAVVPVKREESGVPIGVQMIAAAWGEEVLIKTSLWWQSIVGEMSCDISWDAARQKKTC